MDTGWIRLHRSIMEHWLWKDEPFSKAQAWIDLLLLVNHQEKKMFISGTLCLVHRGEMKTSFNFLAKRWKWNRKKVVSFLNVLSSDGMIKFTREDNKGAIKGITINVENYSKFQCDVGEKGQLRDNGGTIRGQLRDNYPIYKNVKNVKNNSKNILSCKHDPSPPTTTDDTINTQETFLGDASMDSETLSTGDAAKAEEIPSADEEQRKSRKANDGAIYREIVEYLNEKAGTDYKASTKATRKKITARLNEGFTVEDFKRVIDIKTSEWLDNPKMAEYLRPLTLFGSKFEGYLQQKNVKPKVDARVAQSEQEWEAICQMWE